MGVPAGSLDVPMTLTGTPVADMVGDRGATSRER
jgi:hypothetical protein